MGNAYAQVVQVIHHIVRSAQERSYNIERVDYLKYNQDLLRDAVYFVQNSVFKRLKIKFTHITTFKQENTV